MMEESLIQVREAGLYCPGGDFYIDPWKPVATAIITHAHSDHAKSGSSTYISSKLGERLLRLRLGPELSIESLEYGERRQFGDVVVSLHSAGHILGSAQVRIEGGGRVTVISGDFKCDKDATTSPFELIECDEFVTETTFGLPIYRWPNSGHVIGEINDWWRENQANGRPSILFAYALGKSQRILAELDSTIGPIYTHGAVQKICQAYRESGIVLPETASVVELPANTKFKDALIVAPPSARGTLWMKRFGRASTGFASGWMRVRGMRRRRAIDRGFVISDHADWPALMSTIEKTGAQRVFTTHGYALAVAQHLAESGRQAFPLETAFVGELIDEDSGIGEAE